MWQMALAALKYKDIIKHLPVVLTTIDKVTDLIKTRSGKDWAGTPGQAQVPVSPIADIQARLEALEKAEVQQAEVLRTLAEQVQALAARGALNQRIAMAGVLLGLIAVAIALLRE